jgi:hypothetical protein
MRGNRFLRLFLPCLLLSLAMACLVVRSTPAAIVSFSGTVTYDGSYAADSLYVAVMDTNTAGSEPSFIGMSALAVGPPPFSQPFEISFDNALATGPLVVAAALDLDGGGIATINSNDIVGWYASAPDPTLISPATSHSGIDFSLPKAEIRGAVTFGPDQLIASINALTGEDCQGYTFHSQLEMDATGPYTILGLYPGTYCVNGGGLSMSLGWFSVCYGDPLCTSPTFVTLTESQIVTGVDLDYSAITPTESTTWGTVKGAYR